MFKTPQWFYSFIPFKLAVGCSSTLIPLFIISLGGTAMEISLISSAYSLASMVFLIIWGKLSDTAQKRKPFIIIGFGGTALSFFLFSQTYTLSDTLFYHVLAAIFTAATIPVSSVFLLRSARKAYWDQAIGEFNRISGYAWAFGMLLGTGLLIVFEIQILFIILGVIALFSVVLFQKMVTEKPIYINRDNIVSFSNTIVEKLRLMPIYIIHFPRFIAFESRKLKHFYLASFLIFVSSGLLFTPFVYFLTGKGGSSWFIFFISFLNALISAYYYSRTASQVALFGGYSILQKGLAYREVCIGILVISSLLSGSSALLLATLCFCVLGYTWAQITIASNSVISRLSVRGKEGEIMGMYNFMISLGLIIGNVLSGLIVDILGFPIEFGCGFLTLGMALFWIRQIKLEEDAEMKGQVKTAFERSLSERKKWWNVITFEKIDRYLAMAGIGKHDSVLDVATGNGIVAYRLAKRGCRVVAMDIVPTPLFERMPNTQYLIKDAEEMDFKNQFDAVTVRNSFHYFPNPRMVLKRIRTALRKNGTLLIMQPIATEASYPFLKSVFEKKAPVRTFFTEEELEDMVKSEKFTIIDKKIEDYANWVRTDSEEKIKGIHTSYSKGILYFSIPRGYIILIAKKL
ncbi:MAG: MFS transporter [Candidatus Thorarchaeota archaeon]|jgi:ubiquinone/menaquinone biosynthesis C-methylase UbiE/MFS-type transporter involved in bile tolerance (Atg22 family)